GFMPRLIFLTIASRRRSAQISKHKNTTQDCCKSSAIRGFDLFLTLYELAKEKTGALWPPGVRQRTPHRLDGTLTDATKLMFINHIETLLQTEQVSIRLANLMKRFSSR